MKYFSLNTRDRVYGFLFSLILFFAPIFALSQEVAVETEAEEDPTGLSITIENIPGDPSVVVGDFVVGPGKIDTRISPGKSRIVNLTITNRLGSDHIFKFDIEDMTGSSEPSKTVQLLGDEKGPYTLKEYIQLPSGEITLQHNERAVVPVRISIPADAEPGGRYGSVLVNTVAIEADNNREQEYQAQSPIVARIGTLFFVTVPGDVETAGRLLDFTTVPDKDFYSSGPVTFGVTFGNSGSIHLAPYGTLSITDLFGREVGYVELQPWFAMPQTERFREIIWDSDYLFGRYTATLKLNRSYENIIDEREVVFFVLPWKPILVAFIVIFVFVYFLRTVFNRFEFRRKV